LGRLVAWFGRAAGLPAGGEICHEFDPACNSRNLHYTATAIRRMMGDARPADRAIGSRRRDDRPGDCAMPSILDYCQGLPAARFAPGDILLAEGDRSGKLYFLIEGQVEILKGDYQINVVSDPGAVFGEISILLGIPHMATVRAVAPTSAFAAADGDAFLQAHREIAYHLSKILAQRLHGVTSYLVDLKRQFEDHESHLGIVDEVLETLVHQQAEEFTPGSDRDPNIKL
jgi:CRP/FNR family cyclic AMP-dependent transcriptional regulator